MPIRKFFTTLGLPLVASAAAFARAPAVHAGGTRSAGPDITWTPGVTPEAPVGIGGTSRLGNGQPTGVLSFSWTAVSPLALPETDQGRIAIAGAYTRNLKFK